MKYVTITAPQPRKYYVARQLLGAGDNYTIICTCSNEQSAREIAEKLNSFSAHGSVTVVHEQKPLKKKVALV